MSDLVLNLARPEILNLKAYDSARSQETQAKILLDANESPVPALPGEEFAGVNRYPDPQPQKLREKLAELYDVEPGQLLLGRGTDDAIDVLIRTFCTAGKDNILICPPTYGVYQFYADIQGAGVVKIPLIKESGFSIDTTEILKRWNPTIKIIFLCSPNNPTGNTISLEEVSTLCKELFGRVIVVLDEAYLEFSKTKSGTLLLTQFPNLVLLRTLSKAWGLAGARCGVAIASTKLIALLQKVRAPYPLATPSVQLVLEALSKGFVQYQQRIKQIQQERKWLQTALKGLPMVEEIYPSEANFLLVRVKNAPAFLQRCQSADIIVRDRSQELGLEGCIRISIGTPEENRILLKTLQGELP